MLKSEAVQKLVRFGVVGLVVMAWFMALNWLFGRFLGEGAAFLAAYPPALALHYLLSKRWTFRDTAKTDGRKITDYLFTVAVTFVIQWVAFTTVRRTLDWPPWVAAGVANLVQMAASFLLMQHRVFKARHAADQADAAGGRNRWWWHGLTLACAGGVAACYLWTLQSTRADLRLTGEKTDYFNLLVDGFQSGQLHLKTEVSPKLAGLTASEPPGDAPFLLDASLYRGRYYLYFGVMPVLLLHWPYSALTGHDLPDGAANLLLALAALLAGFLWWREMRRQVLPALGPALDWLAILALGLGTAVPSVLRRPLFYEEAALMGWMFGALMLWALARAWRSERRSGAWLVAAGLAYGLAVGSRANLVLAGGLALVLGALLIGSRLRTNPGRGRWLALVLAAAGALPLGIGLAAYNHARFGSITEFGHSYQLGLKPRQLFHTANLTHNLGIYYLHPPQLNAYFPYVLPPREAAKPEDYVGRESAHGEWLWLWVAVASAPALWFAGRARRLPFLLPAAAWFAGNLLLTGLTGVRANRYMLDFHPALVCVTLAGIGWAVAERRQWAWRTGLVALVVLASLFNLLASFQVHGLFEARDAAGFRRCAEVVDRMLLRFAPGIYRDIGEQQTEIRWPPRGEGGTRRVLLAGVPGFDDQLWVRLDGTARAAFELQHSEHGSSAGPWFDYEPGRSVRLRVTGALVLPPAWHGWYGDRGRAERVALKRRLRILVDDQPVFDRDVPSFSTGPSLIQWGELRTGPVQVGALDDAWTKDLGGRRGLVRLNLRMPGDRFGSAEPLVQTGVESAWDVVYVHFTRPDHARVVHDSGGAGAVASEEFAVDYDRPQMVEIETPATYDGLEWNQHDALVSAPVTRLTVRWNGRPVLVSSLPPHASGPADVAVGMNDWSSGCRPSYAQEIEAAPWLEPLPDRPADLWTYGLKPAKIFIGSRGVLSAWQRADQRRAALVWQRKDGEASVRLGWLDNGRVVWSPPLGEAPEGTLEFQLTGAANAEAGQPGLQLFRVRYAGKELLSGQTDFFPGGSVPGLALEGSRWTTATSATGAARTAEPPVPGRRPGRTGFFFALPAEGVGHSVPLLSAGKAGAADGIYLRPVGGGAYVFGHDHWGVGAAEGAPVVIAPGRVCELTIELGSLFAPGSPEAGGVRVWLDGVAVLDVRGPTHPVQPSEMEIGRNSVGFSTSAERFPGEIYSVRHDVAAPR